MKTIDLSVQEDVDLGLIVFIICLSVPLLILIIVGNAIVIISIYRKSSSVRSPSEIFILSLALFDFLTGLFGIPFAVIGYLIRKQFSYIVNCAIWYFVPNIICSTTSITNLFVISIDRFIAIKYPLRYHVWMSPGRAIRICIFADLFGIFFGSISFIATAIATVFVSSPNVTYEYDCGQYPLYDIYGGLVSDYVIRPTMTLTIPFLFILYGYIFTIASKKTKEAATRRGETVSTREMKITKTAAIVLLGYTLCVSPNIIKSNIQIIIIIIIIILLLLLLLLLYNYYIIITSSGISLAFVRILIQRA
ncbi:histamine H2 receptor-like [Anneissia japonica]|uniref:histamine H2 receptor-like n=1 Tax=Anneissia japonica TaxID=1529436 RepID=UPI001425983E|nr:histamine H2 receptor-like [Anneissia japonica]